MNRLVGIGGGQWGIQNMQYIATWWGDYINHALLTQHTGAQELTSPGG